MKTLLLVASLLLAITVQAADRPKFFGSPAKTMVRSLDAMETASRYAQHRWARGEVTAVPNGLVQRPVCRAARTTIISGMYATSLVGQNMRRRRSSS